MEGVHNNERDGGYGLVPKISGWQQGNLNKKSYF